MFWWGADRASERIRASQIVGGAQLCKDFACCLQLERRRVLVVQEMASLCHEQAHARCREQGIPCSDMELVPWGDGQGIRAFFAEVGGIVFEVMRVEATR